MKRMRANLTLGHPSSQVLFGPVDDARMDLYRFFDADNQLLYIGISLSAAQRASQHRAGKSWWDDVRRMDVEKISSVRAEAEAVERAAIRAERPLYNVVHAVRQEWLCRSCGKPVNDGCVVLLAWENDIPRCDQRRCARPVEPGLHPCGPAGMPCYGQRWLGGFLRFGDLLAAGDTEHWYVEHSSRRCLRPLASRDGDFVMDLEQAIKIAAGEIPAPGYGPTVYSTEVPSEAPLE